MEQNVKKEKQIFEEGEEELTLRLLMSYIWSTYS